MKIIKLSASWCQPCKQLTKVMQSMQLPYPTEEVDIDEKPEVAIKYGVRGVPALFLVDDDGTVVKSLTGAKSQQQLEDWLKS